MRARRNPRQALIAGRPARLGELPAEDVLLAPVELLAERLAAG